LALVLIPTGGHAQSGDVPEDQVRVAVRGDSAYVYHTLRLPLDAGVHVERSVGGGAFERVTETPVRTLQDPRLLPSQLGAQYDAVEENLRARGPDAVFFRLRADAQMDLFLSFAYPRVAQAMGRLVIDPDAPLGQPVTYRIVVVDGLDEPTGQTVDRSVEALAPVPAPTPQGVVLSNRGADMRIEWSYPAPSSDRGDQVLRFEVLRIDPATGARTPVSARTTLLRNEAQDEFFYLFRTPTVGQTVTYAVAAVQMTGRRIESEPVTYAIVDNVPPRPVTGLSVFMTPDSHVELSWRLSPEPDVAGYRLFRAPRLTAAFQPVTDSLLGPLETVYVDSTTQALRVYHYKVAAVDSAGNTSALSNPAMARVKDERPPETPVNPRATFQDDDETVRVAWTAAVPPDLYSFEVFYQRPDTPAGKAWARAHPGQLLDTTLVATGIDGRGFAEGAVYAFGVAAVDSSLNRSDTAFVRVKIPDRTPPEPPPSLQALDEEGVRTLLRWGRSPSFDTVEYVLYRREVATPDTVDTVLVRTNRTILSAQDDTAVPGETYTYAVSAVDSLGNEGPRTEPVTFQLKDRDAPPAPRGVQAVGRPEGGALVAWDPAPGSDVVGYRLYHSSIATGIYEPVTPDVISETRYEDAAGRVGRFYRVYAVDASGNTSSPSAPAVAQQPRTSASE
jgi:fibronectin type 3 domain-containing protein